MSIVIPIVPKPYPASGRSPMCPNGVTNPYGPPPILPLPPGVWAPVRPTRRVP